MQKLTLTRSPLFLLALCALLFSASACANRGYQRAARASTSIDNAADDLQTAQQRLAQASTALQQLVHQPAEDIRPQFRAYSSAVNDLESTAGSLDRRAEQLQQRRHAYLTRWDEQNQAIQTDEVRDLSLARQQEVTRDFARLEQGYQQARESFVPLMTQMRDIERMLGVDLTAAGVANARDLAGRVEESVAQSRSALAQLVESHRAVSATLDPETMSVAE